MSDCGYGIPYMGSKSQICKKLVRTFPSAENFYDLFGGGFSVTHAMLLYRNKDYKNFYFNEPRSGIVELIKDAINGKYSYDVFKPKFISRDEFFRRKDNDAYVRMCWSFGFNGEDYLFSKEIEPYKRSMHNAIVFNEFDGLAKKMFGFDKFKDEYSIKKRKQMLSNRVKYYLKVGFPNFLKPYINEINIRKNTKNIDRLRLVHNLITLERVQNLKRMNGMQGFLNFSAKSYEDIEIKPNSVVYCDPPYENTGEYDENKTFNKSKFFNWAYNQDSVVFISEYNIEDDRFQNVWDIDKLSLFKIHISKVRKTKKEKLYIAKKHISNLIKMRKVN